MRKAAIPLVGAALAIGVLAARAGPNMQDFSRIERGRYLTEVGDCQPCHTAQPNGAAFAGGRPIETPFGTIVSANITPDRGTGIGAWSDDDFVRAVAQGVRRDGQRLYPAMP